MRSRVKRGINFQHAQFVENIGLSLTEHTFPNAMGKHQIFTIILHDLTGRLLYE